MREFELTLTFYKTVRAPAELKSASARLFSEFFPEGTPMFLHSLKIAL